MRSSGERIAEAERPWVLPLTDRIETEEELPGARGPGYHPTMVLAPSAGEKRTGFAIDDTGLGPTVTNEGALVERLTRDRILRSLFGEHIQAPTIGRYTFLKELGQGGMGVVCTAYDPKLDRKVAIKLIRRLARAGVESRARMLREAQAMARLSHPNVVQVYEVGEIGDEMFVAMEFVDGVDLSEWLAVRRRGWREVQRVFLEAGRGLAAAHAAGLVHRDFKPANVFVGADGRVIVGDFGLARATSAAAVPDLDGSRPKSELDSPLTVTGTLHGTPAYMAPECFEHNVSDALSDQFAFCVALFEALYGDRPFTGRDVAALARAVLDSEPTIPAGADVPAWLQQVVLRGLQKRPERRWPSMNALLAALAADPAARARALRRGALAVSLVTVCVLGLGWLAAAAHERAEQEESAKLAAEAARDQAFDGLRVAAQRSDAEASRARDALRLAALRRFDGLGAIEHVDDPTSSAALLREVEAPGQLRGWRLSAVEALEQPIARVVLPGWFNAAFTPDGQRIVTRDGEQSVSVWRTDGTGAPVTFGAREGQSIARMALAPDGRHVAIGYRDGLVRLHPLDGAPPTELRGPGFQVTALSWRDDASQLLVSSWETQPGVTIRRSQLWNFDGTGATWRDFPGSAVFLPTSGLVLTDANRSPLWGPMRHASVRRGDGGVLGEFPEAQQIEAAPAGDAVLVLTERTLALKQPSGAAIGAPLDHAALLAAGETLTSAKFTPDGSRVVSTTSEDRVFVWDVAAAKLLREIDAPRRPQPGMLQWGLGMAISPDGSLLARGYADRTVRVWDIDGDHAPMVLRGHLHAPHELTFSPDGRTLATTEMYVRGFSKTEGLQRERGDFEHTVRLWPVPVARTVQFSAYTKPAAEADLRWLSYSPWTPDGALVVTDGLTLKLYDARGDLLAPPVTVPAQHEHLSEPIFTADGDFVVFEAARHWVRWSLRDPARIETFAQPESEQRTEKSGREHGRGWANLSRDGAHVYYVSPTRDRVRIYDFATHTLVRQLEHDAAVERVEFSPQGDRILTVTKDRRVRVWSVSSDAAPVVYQPRGDGLVYPLWSPDGAFVVLALATAVRDEYSFLVWRPGEPGEPTSRITTPAVLAVTRLSPDGRHLAILGRDDRVRLVTTDGDRAIRELDAVDSEPGKLEFSRDGAWLVSAGSNAAFVWSTATGEVVRVLRSPAGQLARATFDPAGTSVLMSGRDGLLTITPFDPEVARADLRARLRDATSYCYSYARRRVDLNEPPALAWSNFSACERAQGRDPASSGPPSEP